MRPTKPLPALQAVPATTNVSEVEAQLLASPLFDAGHYAQTSGLEFESDLDALRHYIATGEREGLSPSSGFDPALYLERNREVAEYGGPLLLHFVRHGMDEGRIATGKALADALQAVPATTNVGEVEAQLLASPLFDAGHYAQTSGLEFESDLDALRHYIATGEREGLSPSSGFDPALYLERNREVAEYGGPLLLHFVRHGMDEGRIATDKALADALQAVPATTNVSEVEAQLLASPLFDAGHYAQTSGLEFESDLDALRHYIATGEREGLSPSSGFDPALYLERNREVAEYGGPLLLHFVRHGMDEGRIATGKALADALQAVPATTNVGEVEAQLLASSLFDAGHYAQTSGLEFESDLDALRHYIATGEREGLSPSSGFDPALYLERNREVAEYGGPLLLHFVRHGMDEGRIATDKALADALQAVPATTNVSEVEAQLLASPLFDAGHYAQTSGLEFESDLDALRHYIATGEREGLSPSSGFDPALYLECNNDLTDYRDCLLCHFVRHGMDEGRIGNFDISGGFRKGQRPLDESRKTIVMILHEASMTGAPLLGLNIAQYLSKEFNIAVLVLRQGELVTELLKYSVGVLGPVEGSATFLPAKFIEQSFFRYLLNEFCIDGVLANSAETEAAIIAAWNLGMPIVSLVHEFTEYVRPVTRMSNVLDFSTKVVFSSNLTMRSALDLTHTDARHISIIPQGKSVVPAIDSTARQLLELNAVLNDVARHGKTLVIGCGWVQPRKGVDLFIAAADKVVQALGKDRVTFLWVGDNYNPETDTQTSLWLADQIRRSGLQDNLSIIGAIGGIDLERLYQRADVMFLSSRLDPFPNVGIDAIHAGLPVVCFERASGLAEYLSSHETLRKLVAPYLDVHAAAAIISELARNASDRKSISQQFVRLAESQFEMRTYVKALCGILEDAATVTAQEKKDVKTLQEANIVSRELLGTTFGATSDNISLVRHYVSSCASGTNRKWNTVRRPVSGFSPHVYEAHHPELTKAPFENGLAHWIRQGRPEGPWTHGVLTLGTMSQVATKIRKPNATGSATKTRKRAKIAIHLHMHYPDSIESVLSRLAVNRNTPDLLISTSSEENEEKLRKRLRGYSQALVDVRITPNRGRDIGPFLAEFGEALRTYDIIAHLHGKKSVALDKIVPGARIGNLWRDFLLDNLVGNRVAALDAIVTAFEEDPLLGLVFPEDPSIMSWSDNYEIASQLAPRLGIAGKLPKAVEFPVGNMFYARPEALAPLFDAKFTWGDFPKEPVAYDGTMLHALERLTPIVCQQQGSKWVTTRVPGVTR